MTNRPVTLVAALLLSITVLPLQATRAAAPATSATKAAAAASGALRVDQLGYAPTESKVAYLMTTSAVPRQKFIVRDPAGNTVLTGVAGHSLGGWNAAFPAVYPLDLSALRQVGHYVVDVAAVAVASAEVRVPQPADLWPARLC